MSIFSAVPGFPIDLPLNNNIESIKPSNYYPLNPGVKWEYEYIRNVVINKKYGDIVKNDPFLRKIALLKNVNHKINVVNIKQLEIRGRLVTQRYHTVMPINKSFNTYYYNSNETIYDIAYNYPDKPLKYNEPPVIVLKAPINIGSTWQSSNYSFFDNKSKILFKFSVESINDTVAVKAGTFNQCLKIKQTGESNIGTGLFFPIGLHKAEYLLWYAPNVGLIKSIFRESIIDKETNETDYSVTINRELILINDK